MRSVVIRVALVALLSSPALAQQVADDAATLETAEEAGLPPLDPEAAPDHALPGLGADDMIASSLGTVLVFDSEGREVGDVQDTIIDAQGRVVAILIGLGGTLGIGEKPVAIRFEHVSVEERDGERRFVLDLPLSELEASPSFERPEA